MMTLTTTLTMTAAAMTKVTTMMADSEMVMMGSTAAATTTRAIATMTGKAGMALTAKGQLKVGPRSREARIATMTMMMKSGT